MRNWPRPTSKKDLRGFLGLVGYYTTFIYNAANVMKPLHNMTKDNGVVPATPEEWETVPDALAAFENLKDRLCSAHQCWCYPTTKQPWRARNPS